MEKKSKRMWFVNISEYHQQTMGLLSPHYFSSVYHIYLAVYQRLIALSCTSVVGRLRNYSQHLIVTTNCLRQEKWVVRSLLQLSVSVPSFQFFQVRSNSRQLSVFPDLPVFQKTSWIRDSSKNQCTTFTTFLLGIPIYIIFWLF